MPPAWRLARNVLGGRPWRTLLLASAVIIAASLIVAVSTSVRSVQAGVELQLIRYLGASDARVIHPGGGRFEAALLDRVGTWDGVAAVTARADTTITLVREDDAADPATGSPRRATPRAIGISFALEPRFRRIDLLSGAWPTRDDEVLLDPMTAAALDAAPGDRLLVQRFGDPIALRVSGIYERPDLGALQTPRVYVDRVRLGEAAGIGDRIESLHLILEEGIDVAAFCAERQAELPEPLLLEPAELVRTGFDRRARGSRIGLVVATALVFLCAGFIIVTGLTTGVTERRRELAMLRAIGAARSQLFAAQMLVGAVFAAAGAVFGIPLGIALAAMLAWCFRAFVPAGLVVHGQGVALAAIGAAAAGLVGAIVPAFAAAGVSPLEGLAVRARPPRRRSIVLCAAAALLALGLHLLLRLEADPERRFWLYAFAGLPALVLAAFLVAVPTLVGVAAALGGALGRAARLPAGLVRGSALATPLRHGFTAGALMLGVALLVGTWSNAVSLRRDWLGRIRFADGFAFRATGIDPERRAAIEGLPFVTDVCPIGRLPVRIADRQVFGLSGITSRAVVCIGFDAEAFFRINAVDWLEGDPETALPRLRSGEALLVAERFLVAKGLGVGDTITLAAGRRQRTFEIAGVIGAAGLDVVAPLFGLGGAYTELAVSCVFLDRAVVAATFDNEDVHILQVDLADDVGDEEAERAISEAAPGVIFRSGRGIIDRIGAVADGALLVQTTVALAALILASIAVGNVVAADVQARRFEFGVLRAVGATRGTIVRLILAESALLAITAAIVGTALGLRLAAIDARNLNELAGLPIGIAMPPLPLIAGWGIVVLLTLLAVLPAALGIARARPAELVG